MSDEWRVIERAARKQVRADLEAIEAMPLSWGGAVAWVECINRKTDALSAIHRAGDPMKAQRTTLCGEVIPAAILRLALSADLIRVMGRCKYCEALYVQKGAA